MLLPGLHRQVLEHAVVGDVLEAPGSEPAVAAAYRQLDAQGWVLAEWWRGDLLPLQVGITPTGRRALRAARRPMSGAGRILAG